MPMDLPLALVQDNGIMEHNDAELSLPDDPVAVIWIGTSVTMSCQLIRSQLRITFIIHRYRFFQGNISLYLLTN